MMKKLIAGAALLTLLAAPNVLLAAHWTVDAGHSSVTFKVRHFFTKVAGQFASIEGHVHFDPDKIESSSATITIPVASINTNNDDRDKHLKSGDFFDAATHANITFKSSKFTKTKDGKITVDGTLNMRGVDKPVTMDVEFLGAGPDAWGGTRGGFAVTGTINRKDWDINWNKALDHGGTVLGEDVEIQIDLELVQGDDH